jgi:hypothetical protein
MKESEYNKVYNCISFANIQSLSNHYGIPKDILSIILNQKIVRDVRRRYFEIQKKSYSIKKQWTAGEKILSIANGMNFPPALICSLLLKELGFSSKSTKKALKDPLSIHDKRLRSEVLEALREDFVYSPAAHRIQIARGKLGELVLSRWLTDEKISFIPERLAQKANTKTPDFLLEDVVRINDHAVKWIESKASFGDVELHKYYLEKQYSSCVEMFGDGMTVYWYGFVDSIKDLEPRLLVVDHSFFPKSYTKTLLEG